MYLVAIMDWHSRYVLAWRLSNTLDADFCVDALEEALSKWTPEIFNTDQGSQFTSDGFTGTLLERGIQVSMDGKGRFMDNVFVERLWRSVKYEEVYLKGYGSVGEARAGIGGYMKFYNDERLHEALGYQTPRQLFEARHGWVDVRDEVDPAPITSTVHERRWLQDLELVSYPQFAPVAGS